MNSWSPVWEEIFSTRATWNKYPPEELVRFIASYYYAAPDRAAVRVLEVGCGPGGGAAQFIAREGFSFFGIDGSKSAIEKAQVTFVNASLRGTFNLGYIDKLPYEDSSFDCVFDICCLQHNSEAAAQQAIQEIVRVLKPGGRHFSLVAKEGSWGDKSGESVDATSRRHVTEGPYVGMDLIRFASLASLEKQYAGFINVEIESSARTVKNRRHEISHWFVMAQRP